MTPSAGPAKPSQLTSVTGVTAALPAPPNLLRSSSALVTTSTLTLSTASDLAIVHVPSAVTEQLEPGTASRAAQSLAPGTPSTAGKGPTSASTPIDTLAPEGAAGIARLEELRETLSRRAAALCDALGAALPPGAAVLCRPA